MRTDAFFVNNRYWILRARYKLHFQKEVKQNANI